MTGSLIFFGPSGVTLDLGLARCREPDKKHWFFAEDDDAANETRAKAVCNGASGIGPCPIKAACLRYSLELEPDTEGVFAGLNRMERKNRRRANARRARQWGEIDDWVIAQRPVHRVAEPPAPAPPVAPKVYYSRPSSPARPLKKPRLELLLDYLLKVVGVTTEGQDGLQLPSTVTLTGSQELEKLAKAIGYDGWNKAVRFIEQLSSGGVARYSYISRTLTVNCGLAWSRLSRDQSTKNLGDKFARRNSATRQPRSSPPQSQPA